MTDIDNLRDRLAVLCGWEKHPDCHGGWERTYPPELGVSGFEFVAHPIPANDYNALIAAWPEDRGLCVSNVGRRSWVARSGERLYEAPTRYEAELRLTVAVLEASQ